MQGAPRSGPLRGAARPADVACLLILGVAALWWVFDAGARMGRGMPSYDIYGAHYPNMLHALRALREGHGLLWNPFQNCGQPFLPSTLVGLFFPANALFLVLSPEAAYLVTAGVHLLLGGAGMYVLCRSYGLGPAAAFAGAITFQLGSNVLSLMRWLPTNIAGPYVLTPWALFCGERLIRAPTGRTAVGLAIVLALQALGGYPQLVLFTCMLLGLRLVWTIALREAPRPVRTVALVVCAVVASFVLAGVQWLPAMEFARDSVRGAGLTPKEIRPASAMGWTKFRELVRTRNTMFGTVFTAVGAVLGLLGLALPRHRRTVCFYLLAGALFLALMFDNFLFALYLASPVGHAFREPVRFIWLVGVCVAVLTAFGVEAVRDRASRASGTHRAPFAGLALLGTAGFVGLAGAWPQPVELRLGLAALLTVAAAAFVQPRPWIPGTLAVLVAVLVAANIVLQTWSIVGYFDGRSLFYGQQPVWSWLAERMTLQDRMYQFGKHPDYALMQKSPTIFGLRSITDYEPQASRRLAGIEVMLLTNAPLGSISQYYFRGNPVPGNRPLLDLLATRWLVADTRRQDLPPAMRSTMRLAFAHGTVRVYENPRAVPRAQWVPAARVVTDPELLLRALAHGAVDPRRQVLLESPPADGFLGRDGPASGEVRMVSDRSEVVTIEVQAPTDGFLVLTDQDYPGWSATVNGTRVPIHRANYAFRAVRVPAGASTVVFSYRPWSVRLGAALSVVSLLAVTVYLVATGVTPAAARRARSEPA